MVSYTETKRRTVVKTFVWRVIGIIWTWMGAYIILLFIPKEYSKASIVATAIVVYHHSTRLIMYYIYERIWFKVKWGQIFNNDRSDPLPAKNKLAWILIAVSGLLLILITLIYFNL